MGPFDDAEDLPDLNELMRRMAAAGGFGAATGSSAEDFARQVANDGQPEANVDPSERIGAEQLGRIAALHVAQVTGRNVHEVEVVAVTRGEWAVQTLKDLDPFLSIVGNWFDWDEIADSVKHMDEIDDADDAELKELINTLQQMLGGGGMFPKRIMHNTIVGSLAGQLARRSFGSFDVPLPRPAADHVMIVAPNIAKFATEWEIPADDLRLWTCIQEISARVALSSPGLQERMGSMVRNYLSAYRIGANSENFFEAMPDNGDMQDLPVFLLRAMHTDEHDRIKPGIDRAVGLVTGYTDHVVDQVTSRLLPAADRIAEAMRRKRSDGDAGTRFMDQVFGIEMTEANLRRGRAFVEGVVQRGGDSALTRLLADPEAFPTDPEYAAPGLWLERLGFSVDMAGIDEQVAAFEIPDFIDDEPS